ncbi:hypothetical protein [Arthrobacter sp. 92]|uniref:hypothetical protein n=1 Tax=Arthrobacter sp. 92 TaxID=3418175 RepID=UPI003D00A539
MFALLGALGGSGLTAYINRRNTVDTLTSSQRANEEQWDRSHKREHDTWLRDQKQEAYMKFMLAAQSQHARIQAMPYEDLPGVNPEELVIERAGVKVIGSPAVRYAARALESAVAHSHFVNSYAGAYFLENPEGDHERALDEEQRIRHFTNKTEALDLCVAARDSFALRLLDYVEAVRLDLGTYSPDDDELNQDNRQRLTQFGAQDEREHLDTLPDAELA